MRYVQARNYTPGRLRAPRLIIVHTVEGPETPGTAWSVAQWFAGPSAPQASAHFIVDPAEVVGCVHPTDTAWAAPGANADGLQIEHAGRAGQGAAGWADSASQAILRLSASLAASLADRYGIPVRHLTDAQLLAGEAGFVGHDQVSRVYRKSDHTDPGPTFPWGFYLQLVANAGGPAQPEDDMPTVDEISAEVWGPNSQFLVAIADAKYADAKLADGRPAIAPITALRWCLEAVQALRGEVAALRAEVSAKTGGTPTTSPTPDLEALVENIANAVANELSARLVS